VFAAASEHAHHNARAPSERERESARACAREHAYSRDTHHALLHDDDAARAHCDGAIDTSVHETCAAKNGASKPGASSEQDLGADVVLWKRVWGGWLRRVRSVWSRRRGSFHDGSNRKGQEGKEEEEVDERKDAVIQILKSFWCETLICLAILCASSFSFLSTLFSVDSAV